MKEIIATLEASVIKMEERKSVLEVEFNEVNDKLCEMFCSKSWMYSEADVDEASEKSSRLSYQLSVLRQSIAETRAMVENLNGAHNYNK